MQQITIHSDPETAPMPRTRAMAHLTDQTFSRLEHVPGNGPGTFELSSKLAPSSIQRAELSDRKALLLAKMMPATQDELASWVRRLLAGFGGASTNREEASAAVLLYSVLLDGSPTWAIKKAVLAYLKGTVARENNRFAPTPPEFCQLVNGFCTEFQIEIAKISKVLDAKVYAEPSAEQKEQVETVMADHLRRLGMSGNILQRDESGNLTPESRSALADAVTREAQAAATAQRKKDAPPREDIPPPELVDPDAQRLWYEDRLEVLKKRYASGEGLPKLSATAKATPAGRDWGAPDTRYGPAPKSEAAE